MVIKYQISPAPTVLEDLVVKIWEASNDAPGAEVYTQVLPEDGGGGHPAITTIIANGLDLVVHIVRLYGVTSGIKYDDYNHEPTIDVVTTFSPIRFKIGDGGPLTPVAGTTDYTDPLFDGLTDTDFVVIRNNKGALHPPLHYSFFPLLNKITLTNPDVWEDVDEVTILILPQVAKNLVNDSVVGKWFGGFVDVAAPVNYDAAHLRKLIRFKATSAYTFNTTVPIGYAFVFQNFGPNLGQVGTINFTFAPLLWGTTTKSTIDIPLYGEACFVFDGVNFNVVYISEASFINGAATPQPGAILGVGLTHVGDIPFGTDVQINVTHNKGISGDYIVMLSNKGTFATYVADDDNQLAWIHHATDKPNKFVLICGDPFHNVGNVSVAWILIKI